MKAEVGSRLINTRDAFGVCARGGKGYENDIFLIFRGTTSANHKADWVSDARIGVEFSSNGLPVHIGFNSIFRSMLHDIKQFFSQHPDATGTVHCVGHSLGGAVATLAADWVSAHKPNQVKLYTFGAPRPGLFFFANNLTRKLNNTGIFRVYHATDPVPMVPIFPFLHPPLPGYGHFVPSNESIISAAAHDIEKYLESVKTSDWRDLQRRQPLYHTEHAIEQWLQSKIPVNPASPKVWQWINAALIYVLKKTLNNAVFVLNGAFMGTLTIVDSIAWVLRKGVEMTGAVSRWVLMLMRKIMQALGMKIAETADELTRGLMRWVLQRLTQRLHEETRKAIQRSSIM